MSKYKDEERNMNFVQYSDHYLMEIGNLAEKNVNAFKILQYLTLNMDRKTNALICSYRVFEEVFNISRSTIRRSIKVLKDDNWIDVVKVGSVTAYAVNGRVVWRIAKNQRKYALFSATVIAAGSEQLAETLENRSKMKSVRIAEPNEIITISDDIEPPAQNNMELI